MIFIDQPQTHNNKYKNWCHMVTDGNTEELHIFAEKIGLRRAYYQNKNKRNPHYDLSPTKQTMAISLGAIRVANEKLIEILRSTNE